MQQLFRLLIFLIQPHMFRATNSPILRSTFWLYIQLLVQFTDTAADRCHGWNGTSNSLILRSTFWLYIHLLVYGKELSGSINAGNFLTSGKVYWLASQEGLCPMEYVSIDSFWYNVPTLLPTGALYQKLCIQSKRAPEDGWICRPKHEGLN